MTGQFVSPLVAKEIRALLPAAAACVATMVLSAAVSVWPLSEFGLVAYLLGIAALAGLSMGHEYAHRTLGMLLSLPVRRERLLLIKLSVLGVTLLMVSALGSIAVLPRLRAPETIRMAFVLAPMVGVCVGPWLTMACHSAIAGAAFTLALPGALITLIQLAHIAVFRQVAPIEVETPALWAGSAALCAIGAIAGWRTFMQLEAIEGMSPAVGLLRWPRSAETSSAGVFSTGHPIWLLVKKEIRLQEVALVVACVYLLCRVAAGSLQPVLPRAQEAFNLLSVFYAMLVALLIGAVASAEERQLGTLEWQLLLPVSSRKQWVVKVAVVVSLALLLALALPAMLVSAYSGQGAVGVVAAAIAGLYVSSTCSTGLWAMVLSLPFWFGAVSLVIALRVWLAPLMGHTVRLPEIRFESPLETSMLATFLALLLWLAFRNHRSADRGSGRFWVQGLWLIAGLTAGTIVTIVVAR
jgi:ABC-type transport system involved in multi-copper enzyme maturation permease subunit